MNYLDYAKSAMEFIDTRKKQGPVGIYWSLADAAEGRTIYYDEISIYAGASGIICFLLGLYDETKEERYLKEAEEAAKYIIYRWENDRELKRNFSKYAFSSGWCGAGFALNNLYQVTKNETYKDTIASIITQAIADSKKSEDGVGNFWCTYPGIVGNAGTILFILKMAETYENEEWKKFAVDAGRIYLNKGKETGDGGMVYLGVDPTYFGAGDDYIDPNFPMGTAGIGFTLLKLYDASGDQVFLDAVEGIPKYLKRAAVKIKAGKLLPHAFPDRPNMFYLSYCHGPAGTTRFYYELYKHTGKKEYLDAIETLVQGLEDMGAPKIHSEGYWNVYNVCCGTAGILNMYLGIWAATGEEKYLIQAKKCGEELTEHAINEGEGTKWRFALDRVSPDVLTTPLGLLDGAAGIAATLLQLHTAEHGKFHAGRMLDDPFPDHSLSL